MSTAQDLLNKINSLELALVFLINNLRNSKDGFVVEIPDKTLDNIERLILNSGKK
jgi:hypothetical protein